MNGAEIKHCEILIALNTVNWLHAVKSDGHRVLQWDILYQWISPTSSLLQKYFNIVFLVYFLAGSIVLQM